MTNLASHRLEGQQKFLVPILTLKFQRAVLLIIISLVINNGWSQTTLFQFTFEDALTSTVNNTSGTPVFSSSGVGGLNFNATTPCEGSKMYQGSYWSIGDFYQFAVNTTGFSSLSFSYCERGSNVLIGNFQVRVSPDGLNWTILRPDYTPPLVNTNNTTVAFPVSCENTSNVLIQIYKTSAPTSTGQSLRLDNAILTGFPETLPPVATFNPTNGAINILLSADPIIAFDEPVRKTDGTPLNDGDLTTLLEFKINDANGSNVPFTATINAEKTIINVYPAADLLNSQMYYLAVGPVEDQFGNESSTQNAVFTTVGTALSSDATLSDLKVDGNTVLGFSPSVNDYNIELPYGTTTVPNVTAIPNFGLASVVITPAAALPGNTAVLVTAQDSTTQITYSVIFSLSVPSNNANLNNLRWLPNGGDPGKQTILVTGFNASTLSYNVEVPEEVASLTLVASAAQNGASLLITPPTNLLGNLSQRTGTVQVTAQDGITTLLYSVVFTVRLGMTFNFKEGFATFPPNGWNFTGNISLSTANGVGLYASGLSSPKFKWTAPSDGGILITPECNTAGILEFYIRVLDDNLANALHLFIEKSNDGGINWTTLSTDPMPMSGNTSIWHQVVIPVNDNSSSLVFRFRGSALTGTTSIGLFYVDDISVSMNSDADASLSDLKMDGVTINGFSSNILNYNVILPAGTTNIPFVTAFVNQPLATSVITYAMGLPGSTTILVTAPDGITTNTYYVNFALELAAPYNLTVDQVLPSQVNLAWSDNNLDEDGFIIERKPNSGFYAHIANVGANVTSVSNMVPGLNPNDFIPADRFSGVTVTSGIKFADVIDYQNVPTSLYLDVYEPTGDNTLGRPVIIWIHGGGFRTGSVRTQGYIVDYSTRFAKRGYVCVSIDYRLRDAASMPTQASEFPALQDAARDANAAIDWIRTNAKAYHIDPNLIFIAGGSAGGRTAQTVCQFDGPDPTAVHPPENLYLTSPWNKTGIIANATLWGGLEPEMRDWVYPYLQPTDVPTILIHGNADVTILPQNSIDLDDTLTSTGITSELHLIPGATHSCLGHETQISIWLAAFFAQEWNKLNSLPTSYSYRICAYNSIGISPFSGEALTSRTLNLTTFLEGLYDGGLFMRKAKNTFGDQYTGNITDQLTVELHSIYDYSAILYSSTNINLSNIGKASVIIPVSLSDSYYVTLKNRNHIETVSADPVSFASQNIKYNFSDASNKAFGNNLQLKNGKFCIYGGDVNQDGIVDSSDLIISDNETAIFNSGYISADVNGDGIINALDINIVGNNATQFVGKRTP